MVTNVLRDQQYMFDVRSLLVGEKVLLIKDDPANVMYTLRYRWTMAYVQALKRCLVSIINKSVRFDRN